MGQGILQGPALGQRHRQSDLCRIFIVIAQNDRKLQNRSSRHRDLRDGRLGQFVEVMRGPEVLVKVPGPTDFERKTFVGLGIRTWQTIEWRSLRLNSFEHVAGWRPLHE